MIDREFERSHLGVDRNALTGDSVVAVFAEHLIEGMREIQPADVAITGPAEVVGLDVMIAHIADRRRPSDEIILVVSADSRRQNSPGS